MAPEASKCCEHRPLLEDSECGELNEKLIRSPLKDGPPWIKLILAGYVSTVAWLAHGPGKPTQEPARFAGRLALYGVAIPAAMFTSFAGFLYCSCSRSKFISQKVASVLVPTVCVCVIDWKFKRAREELLKGIRGSVLDVGCGSGPYLPYYVRSRKNGGGVTKAVMLEPNPHMHASLKRSVQEAQALEPGLEVEIRGGYLDSIAGEHLFDSIVFGNVLCEVPHQEAFLKDIGRVLKPGGRVYFSEHCALKPKDSFWRRVQERINPYWTVLTDGCNINRDTVDTIKAQPWVQDLRSWSFPMDNVMGTMELGIVSKKA